MATWSERLWQGYVSFMIVFCIILGILELWVLFGREPKGKTIVKEVFVTYPGANDFTTTQGPPCPRPDLLENNICDNEIRMEKGCRFDHEDCKHNPDKSDLADQMCGLIQEIGCQSAMHKKYPYCQACGGHPMKSWLKTFKELQDQLEQLQSELTTTPKTVTESTLGDFFLPFLKVHCLLTIVTHLHLPTTEKRCDYCHTHIFLPFLKQHRDPVC